jgi:hypothetical protein
LWRARGWLLTNRKKPTRKLALRKKANKNDVLFLTKSDCINSTTFVGLLTTIFLSDRIRQYIDDEFYFI